MGTSYLSKYLDIHPLELRFPFEPNKLIQCPVTLTNKTDHYVGVWITPTGPDTGSYLRFPAVVMWERKPGEDPYLPVFSMLEPRSTVSVLVTMKQHQRPTRDTGTFEVLMAIVGWEEDLEWLKRTIGSQLKADNDFLQKVEDLGGEVHRAVLNAFICDSTNQCTSS